MKSALLRVCLCVSQLTEGLHRDDFILTQTLASLVVSKPPRVEKPALDTLPEAEDSKFNVIYMKYH